MPHHVLPQKALDSLNATLAKMSQPGQHLPTLSTPTASNPAWSCNNVAPLMLEMLSAGREPHTTLYMAGDALPTFVDCDFVNIMLQGDPSSLNHNINILVADGHIYLFQAYVGRVVDIVRKFETERFRTLWHDLCAGKPALWKPAYQALFGVDPDDVVQTDDKKVWFQSQYVSV